MQVEALLSARSYYEQPKAHDAKFSFQIKVYNENGKLEIYTKNTIIDLKETMCSAIECICSLYSSIIASRRRKVIQVHYLHYQQPSNVNLNGRFESILWKVITPDMPAQP